MKTRKYALDIFLTVYLSVMQIMIKLADPTFLFAELGRGSGKTTHILAPRIDRVQNDMPGAVLVLAASTYKSILDNILPGLMEYFYENYERGVYFEIGKEPPKHFAKCVTYIDNWKHTISFVNGCVIQFVSCDRPESMLGKNAAHLFVDEMLRIPEDKFTERIIPALRADRSKFGHSHYFMGITGISSTPNFETDEDWWTKYEKNMNPELIKCIQEIAYEIDLRKSDLVVAENKLDEKKIKKLNLYIERWSKRLTEIRRGQTFYARASSFSNIKILGLDYIENQIKNIKDVDRLNTSILAVRKHKVKDRFFGKFGKEHTFSDGYKYDAIDQMSIDAKFEHTCKNLKYWDKNLPLIIGLDPGPFSSLEVAQHNKKKKEFRVIKDMWVIHPDQHEEMAEKFDNFFKPQRMTGNKSIIFHYDRAANQRDPHYRKFYKPSGDLNDTDAQMLKIALTKRGWNVTLMSLGQPTIYYSQHYRLLNLVFGKNEGNRSDILIDENECEATISSINHSPIKRTEGKIELDKSSEKLLEYKDQAYYSTQISSALMYLIWGEFSYLLPDSERKQTKAMGAGTYHT